MRFSDRITFIKQEESYYDPDEGGYVESEPIPDKQPCKLSQMGMNRRKELFGELDEYITIARLQRPYKHTFDYVHVDGQRYQVKQESNYRKGVLFLVGDSFGD